MKHASRPTLVIMGLALIASPAAAIDDRHFFFRLQEIERHHERVDDEARNAAGIASFAGPERDLPGYHVVIGFLHRLLGPGLQDRIVEIGHPVGRLDAGTPRRAG